MRAMTFQPDQDSESSSVRIQMPPGTTLEQSKQVAEEAATIIKHNPNVQDVFMRSFVGSAYVNVLYKKDRTKKSFQIEREINPQLAQIADARVNFNSRVSPEVMSWRSP